MSIIILTPPPKNTSTASSDAAPLAAAAQPSASVAVSLGEHLESAFLHLIGLEGHRLDSWEAVRDFAAAQIAAAAPAAPAAAAQP